MPLDWSLAANPVNPLQALQAFGIAQQRAQQEREQQRIASARGAAGEYFRSRYNANQQEATTSAPATAPMADAPGASPPLAAPTSMAGSGAAQPASAAGLVELGMARNPQMASPSRAALDRVSQFDPAMAFELEANERKAAKDDLEFEHQLNMAGINYFARARDQASYNLMKGKAARLLAAHGRDIDELGLPDKYDPEVVQSLLISSLDYDKQLAAQRSRDRLEWDIQDDEADNVRADRDIDSRMTDRDERRNLISRNISLTDSRGRRGQDISSADRRRGQDLTDRRVRETASTRPQRTSSTGQKAAPARVATKADYDKLRRGDPYIAPDGSTRRKN